MAKKDLKVRKRSVVSSTSGTAVGNGKTTQSSATLMHERNDEIFEEMSSVKQKLFEKNCRVQFLEKQSLRDKADLDAKDKLIEKEAAKLEELQKKLDEANAKNQY